jgi:hypothetical protein
MLSREEIDQANKDLSFAISLLRGEVCDQPYKSALSDAITIVQRLKNIGFLWQANMLNAKIHLAQKKGDFLGKRHENHHGQRRKPAFIGRQPEPVKERSDGETS